MSKTLYAVSGSALIILLMVVGYLLLNRNSDPAMDALRAVPVDAALIFETNDLEEFIHKVNRENKIWKELVYFEGIERIDRNMHFLDSLIQNIQFCKELLHRNTIYVSAHQTGKNNIGLIWILKIPQGVHEKQIHDLMVDLKGNNAMTTKEYNRIKIFHIDTGKGKEYSSYSYAISNRLLIMSSSAILLERALRQIELDERIIDSYGFRKVTGTAGKNVDANLYVNFDQVPVLFSFLLNDQYRSLVKGSVSIGEWAELDVNIKEDNLLLNGFSYGSDSTTSWLNLFKNQATPVLKVEEVLPSNTIAFLDLGITDFQEFRTNYEQFLQETGRMNDYQKELARMQELFDQDVRDVFYAFLEDEMGIALMDIKNFTRAQNSLLFFKTRSRSEAEEALLNLIQSYVQGKNQNASMYINRHRIDAETEFPVYQLPVPSLVKTLFGKLVGEAGYTHFAFVDNYLFFGNSTQALSRLVHQNILRKTLRSELSYTEFAENLSSRANVHLYIDIPRLQTVLSPFLLSTLSEGIEKNVTPFQKLQALAIQFSVNHSMAYNNVFLKFQPLFKEEALTVWESLLDTSISFKPQFVENHYTHDNEIFLQDDRNNIYLINSAGRILWKVQLNEKIMGNAYQIDYYKNNKLQLLFNTRSQIHLIDRNGNYVERYPVNLRAKATNPISVFDYDKSRDYRIFVAGEDQNVYVYSKEGNIVKGWSFKGTESAVTSEIQHFRIGNRDYIVFADQLKIYIQDRRGSTRVKLNRVIPKSKRNNVCLDYPPGSSNPRMAITDTAGTVYYISFSGRIETLKIKEYSAEHFFDLEDMDGDGFNDLVFLDHGRLEVFSQNRSKMLSYDFEEDIDLKPVCYTFSSTNKKIGIVSRSENRIYLINNDGSLYTGFPLTGNTLFSIGRFKSSGSTFNLIVGNEDNFLYNYSVQ